MPSNNEEILTSVNKVSEIIRSCPDIHNININIRHARAGYRDYVEVENNYEYETNSIDAAILLETRLRLNNILTMIEEMSISSVSAHDVTFKIKGILLDRR